MQSLRNQAACLEGQATHLGDLVVLPVPHLTKLELQLLVLLVEAGNFARLGLGKLGDTLPASKRRLYVEYVLAQLLVLLVEAGNFARLGLGKFGDTLPASKRRLYVEYVLAQQVVLGLRPRQLGLDDCGTQCLDLRVPHGAPTCLPSCIAYHDESH